MVFLITKYDYNYLENITKDDNINNVTLKTGDVVVYEDSVNSYNELLMFLTDCVAIGVKVVYIDSDLNRGKGLYFLFTGLGADILETSALLDTQESLDYLINEHLGTSKVDLQLDIEALKQSISLLAESSGKVMVKKSVDSALERLTITLGEVTSASQELFPALIELKEYIKSIEDVNEVNIKNVENVKEQLRNLVDEQNRGKAPVGYSTYPYVSATNQSLLYIRNIGGIKFLNSFIVNYQDYLKVTFNHRLKVLIVIPNFKQVIERYSGVENFVFLRREGLTLIDTSQSDIFVTSDPKSVVLDKFFSLDADSFIIIDMVNDVDLVTGPMKRLWGCYPSDVKKFNIDHKEVIFSTLVSEGIFYIPHIKDYIKYSPEERKSWYYRVCGETYDKLADYMQLNLNR